MTMKRKNFIGFIIGIFFLAGTFGGFIGYFFPRIIEEGVFNVTIDGKFNTVEGWQHSDWQFVEYLLVDDENLNTHNFHMDNFTLQRFMELVVVDYPFYIFAGGFFLIIYAIYGPSPQPNKKRI